MVRKFVGKRSKIVNAHSGRSFSIARNNDARCDIASGAFAVTASCHIFWAFSVFISSLTELNTFVLKDLLVIRRRFRTQRSIPYDPLTHPAKIWSIHMNAKLVKLRKVLLDGHEYVVPILR